MDKWYSFLESELPASTFKDCVDIVDNDGQCDAKNVITSYVKLFHKYSQDETLNTEKFETVTKHFLKNVLPAKMQLQALRLVLTTLQGKKSGAHCKGMDFLAKAYVAKLFSPDLVDHTCDIESNSGVSNGEFFENYDLSKWLQEILGLVADCCNPDLYKEGKDITTLNEDCIKSYQSQAISCLQFLHLFLFKLNERLPASSDLNDIRVSYIHSLKKTAVKLYIACISNTGNHTWTNSASMARAKYLQTQLCKSLQCPNISILLTGTQTPLSSHSSALVPKGLLTDVLKIFKENFTPKNWKQHSGLKHVLIFSITQVKYPFLGKEIPVVIPALLNLCDDFLIENRVLGISTLSYVISNINASDLKIYNHADVIYDSLFKHLYNSENPVLEVLLPCLLQVVLVLETKPAEIKVLSYRKIDYVMQQILSLLEMESKLINRRTLLRNLKGYVHTLGLTMVRHMKRLLTVLFDSLKYYDGKDEQARLLALELLECIVTKSGHLIRNHATDIAKNLIVLLIGINSSTESTLRTEKTKQILHKHCGVILIALRSNCGPVFVENICSIQTADVCGDCEEVKLWIKNTLSTDLCS